MQTNAHIKPITTFEEFGFTTITENPQIYVSLCHLYIRHFKIILTL